ncbi:MAG: ribose-phosphate pyrophosphokinase [Candidatus Margulisbacteria bacterium]|nr:ribose-phosphate pyrophosphokinase [Candidatus Margulisiibacteriota bacterium]
MLKNDFSNMRLFCGSSHPSLGKEIADYLGIELGKIQLSTFSCGETYARIEESIRGYEIYILQSPSQNVNDDYMELFIMMDALKRSSAAAIHVILPHFAYARQDRKSAPREPITSRLIADLLTSVGFDRLITMDLHADQIQGFFSQPVDHLTAMPLFVDYFSKKNLPDLVVVSPDTGSAKFAKKLSDRLGATLAILHKSRPAHNIAEITNLVGDVKDKTVLIIDDMVDTAGSVTSAIQALRKHGCREDIYLACTHAVFSGPAIDKLSTAGFKEVVVTNTMDIPETKRFKELTILSCAPMLAEAIRRNYQKESISSLFI